MYDVSIIDRIKEDCNNHGRGRKKWWSEQLGIHKQTLSYWFSGFRRPSGGQLQLIENVFSVQGNTQESKAWLDLLHLIYFDKKPASLVVIKGIILKILGAEVLDSRSLAFLSHIVEIFDIADFEPTGALLQNRIGWLLEVSGKKPGFKPVKTQIAPLVELSRRAAEPAVEKYLLANLTGSGKRWHVYDCPIEDIKRSYVNGYSEV